MQKCIENNLIYEEKDNHNVVITLEDGIVEGGFGQKVATYYGPSEMKVLNYGLNKEFYDRYNPDQLLEQCSMTPNQIIQTLKEM